MRKAKKDVSSDNLREYYIFTLIRFVLNVAHNSCSVNVFVQSQSVFSQKN